MLTVTVPGRPTIALLISREGEALWVSRSTDAPIFLFQENEKETILGRLELLEAQHRACGCSSKTSSWSTKGKCSHCSLVNQWAVTALSRRLLRFTYDDFGKIFVQGRGKHAAIYLDSKRLDTGNDDWSGEIEIHMGDTLCLAPAQVENSKALHLKIVEANQMNMSRDDPIHKGDHLGLTNPQDMEGGLGIVTSDAKNHRCMLASSGASKRKVPGSTTESNEVKLFLVPLGHDMSSVRRKLLAHKAKNLGALVVHDVFESSHILVSQQVSFLREVSEALKLNEGDLRLYIEQNDIPCLLPTWIESSIEKKLLTTGIQYVWHGDILQKQSTHRKKLQDNDNHISVHFKRNGEIAEVFRTLANLHQSSPLLEMDQWKSYMLRIIAGRLTNLDFEIKDDPQTLERLRNISGIGSNSVDKIQEYLESGTVTRIEEFKSDPKRVAMKNMMNIWGVGRKTALDLLNRGFRDISDVRAAIQKGGHFLDRNQLVGVDCYEDILEEMNRDEVKMIGDLVGEIVNELFPGAQVQIMGSYRRQKSTCGDIDVHITHDAYIKKNPEQGLRKIVDLLWERDHLLYHLTFLPGMKTGSSISDYEKSSKHIPQEAWKWSKSVGYLTSKGHDGSSYMGVLQSPKIAGKRRRIDIKFYPWRERIFASLYFTGNGYFNRSMRLWASRKFRFTLNDHGLFHSGTKDRVMEATDEKEVFDKLELVYKEPHERDCFDAVVCKDGRIDIELSQTEFREDIDYVWVK